jgi:TonB family protein
MIRRIAVFGLFCICTVSGYSQDTIRIYMDDNFEIVSKDSCTIMRKVIIDDKKNYHIWDSFRNGIKIFDGIYNSINPWIEHGLFHYYSDAGTLYASGNYDHGYLTGKWIYYNKSKADTVDYTPAGTLLKNIRVLEDGVFVLKENPPRHHFEPNPVQTEYLKNNIHFPPRAMEKYSYGNVAVNLNIKKNGSRTPEVLSSSHKDFTYEVQRLMLAAPDTFFAKLPNVRNGDYIIDIEFSKYDNSDLHTMDTMVTENDSLLPVFVFVEQQAEFKGGSINEFRDWVQRNLIYPPKAVENGEFGRVTVQFVVGINGQVERVKLLHTCGSKALDNEALRVVWQSPRWVPARQKGNVVCQQFVIPVIFMIQ